MPSGSYVTVSTYKNPLYRGQPPYLNIDVYPLREDAYRTTGLCGNYNFNRSDDCSNVCEQYRQELFTVVISHRSLVN